MLRRWLPLALLASCVGCANQVPGPEATGPAQPKPDETVQLAGSGEPGIIGLYHNGSALHVGDPWESAKSIFPPPARAAYDLHDLPQSIPNIYEAHGWEIPSGEGFGVITHAGKVMTAMYQLEKTKQDELDSYLKEQQEGMGTAQPTLISGRSVHFWFWHDLKVSQTLMVCELATTNGLNVTLAMGDDGVLEKLNISEANARREKDQLDNAQNGIQASSPKN
jgi:hypothetical protein